ncbi:MAG: hypothetical protein SNG38_01625 [Rikenellaceae bacterium]
MSVVSYYNIAGLFVRISGGERLVGFSEFEIEALTQVDVDIVCDGEELFAPACELNRFVVDGVDYIFSRLDDGYLFTLENEDGESVSLRYERGSNIVRIEKCDAKHLLRFLLWVAYSLVAVNMGVVPIHSSSVVYDGSAVLFLGESGAGKSTQSVLWRESIVGSRLLNDDSPILRVEDGCLMVYGSPWSGKTSCYLRERYLVRALVRVVKDGANSIVQNDMIHSFAAVYPSFPPMFAYDQVLSDLLFAFTSEVLSAVPVYTLKCTKERAAAQITFNQLYGKGDNQ